MVDVTMTAELVVDIWPNVRQLTLDKVVLEYVFKNELVEKVYRNDKGTFEHILLLTDNSNIIIVVIVDLRQNKIKGHYETYHKTSNCDIDKLASMFCIKLIDF